MPRSKPDAEDALEQAAIQLLADIGWRAVNAYNETYGQQGTLGREHRGEVVLLRELRAALRRLNPGAAGSALDAAVEALTRDRGVLGMTQANREIYQLLVQGVKVAYVGDDGEQQVETIRLIDWTTPANNDFLLVSQLWVAGEMYTRRADLVGFVNGLPPVRRVARRVGEADRQEPPVPRRE
jgi:type I restriction enzyme R subunit